MYDRHTQGCDLKVTCGQLPLTSSAVHLHRRSIYFDSNDIEELEAVTYGLTSSEQMQKQALTFVRYIRLFVLKCRFLETIHGGERDGIITLKPGHL